MEPNNNNNNNNNNQEQEVPQSPPEVVLSPLNDVMNDFVDQVVESESATERLKAQLAASLKIASDNAGPTTHQNQAPVSQNRKQKRLSEPERASAGKVEPEPKRPAVSNNAGSKAIEEFFKSVNSVTGLDGRFIPSSMQKNAPVALQGMPKEVLLFSPDKAQQAQLTSLFPSHHFITVSGLHPHGVLRHCDIHLEHLVFREHFSTNDGVDPTIIVDYKGNPERHQKAKRNVHVVHPIADADDAARLARFREKGALQPKVMERTGVTTCTHPLGRNGFTCSSDVPDMILKRPVCDSFKESFYMGKEKVTHLFSLHSMYNVPPTQALMMVLKTTTKSGYVIVHDFSAGRGDHCGEMTFEVHPGADLVTCQIKGEKKLTHGTARWLSNPLPCWLPDPTAALPMEDPKTEDVAGYALASSLIKTFAHLQVYWIGALPMWESQWKNKSLTPQLSLLDSVGNPTAVGVVDVSHLVTTESNVTRCYSFAQHLLVSTSHNDKLWISKTVVAKLALFAAGKTRNKQLSDDLIRRARTHLADEKWLSPMEKSKAIVPMVFLAMGMQMGHEIGAAENFVDEHVGELSLHLNAMSLTIPDEWDYVGSVLTGGRVKRLPQWMRNPTIWGLMLVPFLAIALMFVPTILFPPASIFHSEGVAVLPGRLVEVFLPSRHELPEITLFDRAVVFQALCMHDSNPPPIDPKNSCHVDYHPPCNRSVGNVLLGIGLAKHIPTVLNNCMGNMECAIRHRVVKERPAYSKDVSRQALDRLSQAIDSFYPVGLHLGKVDFETWLNASKSFNESRKEKLREAFRIQGPEFAKRVRVFVKRENMVKGWNDEDEAAWYAPRCIFAAEDEKLVTCGPWTSSVQRALCNELNGSEDSHVVFVSNMTALEYGEFVRKWLEGKVLVVMGESDGSRFDYHHLLAVQLVSFRKWEKFGVPNLVTKYQVAASSPVRGVFQQRGGTLKFTAVDIMPTGTDPTWVINSSTSAGITTAGLRKVYAVNSSNTLIPVGGDDNKFFVADVAVNPSDILQSIRETWAEYFFKTTVVQRQRVSELEFCSALLWPAEREGQEVWTLAAKPGRWFKSMFQANPSTQADQVPWLRGVVEGVWRDVGFIPIVRAVLTTIRGIIGSGPVKLPKDHEYRLHNDVQLNTSQKTLDMFYRRYDTDSEEVSYVESLITSIKSLPALISHPLLDRMVDVDVYETATKMVAAIPAFVSAFACRHGLSLTYTPWAEEWQRMGHTQKEALCAMHVMDDLRKLDEKKVRTQEAADTIANRPWNEAVAIYVLSIWFMCVAVPLLEELIKSHFWAGVAFAVTELVLSFPFNGWVRFLPFLMHLATLALPYWTRFKIHAAWNFLTVTWQIATLLLKGVRRLALP